MHVNLLPVTLFLLGTVVLYGAAQNVTEMPPNITTTAEEPNVTVTAVTPPQNSTDYPSQNSTTPSNSTELPINGTSVAPPITTTEASNVTEPAPPTTPPDVKEPSGLSDGAIAGIAIGSIAGVGGIGAGVFGLLKYKMII